MKMQDNVQNHEVSDLIDKILNNKIQRIEKSDVEAIGLMGSYSRGEAETYSDVDIVCILKKDANEKQASIEIIDDKYVVTSYVTLANMDNCFIDVKKVTENILGLQQVKILYDPNYIFQDLKERALQFQWTKELQLQANQLVSEQLVGWLEEVHKALQGLLSNHVGKMLNGLFGLTYGMFHVVKVQKGILLNGENSFYSRIIECYGEESRFSKLSEKAFGISNNEGIQDRVVAGLFLFNEITEEFLDVLQEEDKRAIILVKQEIHKELAAKGYFIDDYLDIMQKR